MNHFWAVLDSPNPTFTAAAWSRLAAPVREQLETMGLVNRRTCSHVACPICDDRHKEPVQTFESPSGAMSYAIACPVDGRVDLALEQLITRSIDVPRVVQEIVIALTLTGREHQAVGDRIYFCGYAPYKGQRVEVYLARGLHRVDGATLAAKMKKSPLPQLVWVPEIQPPIGVWDSQKPPAVLTLAGMTRLDPGELVVFRDVFESTARELVLSRAHPENLFARNGDYWRIVFQGCQEFTIKHTKGMGYIARLLEFPEVPASAVHLHLLGSQLHAAVLSGSTGERFDDQAFEEYRALRSRLYEQLQQTKYDGDPLDVSSLTEQVQAIDDELRGAVDLRGELRKSTGKETARTSVSKAIGGAIKKITTTNEDFGRHLKSAIEGGGHPVYSPGDQMEWVVWYQ